MSMTNSSSNSLTEIMRFLRAFDPLLTLYFVESFFLQNLLNVVIALNKYHFTIRNYNLLFKRLQ